MTAFANYQVITPASPLINTNKTLAQMDEEESMYDLFVAIENRRPDRTVRTIEFIDDLNNGGQRKLIFDVTYKVGIEYDEDGHCDRWETERGISINVKPTSTIYAIVFQLIGEAEHLVSEAASARI
ncbi:hypothetical protein [Spirosoma sp.]|uniref:hypothetical protein n=1 Tax=Spirosoma sp. TaxID=1899569 RepID=UPI002622D437|nr:hypothetical protein [Spirosoma sp.]MCX6217697.1 hypothetical protein [Spirosoma sp.]